MRVHIKELKIAIVIGFIITFLHGINAAAVDYVELNEQKINISNQMIRLHIIAEDNSTVSQNRKMDIKRETLKKLEPLLDLAYSVEEAKEIINYNIHIFEDENINAYLEKRHFPFIRYGNFRLPSGYYKALVLEIGEANGSNWWCVLFPTLCFLENSNGIMEEYLEEYEVIFRLRLWDIFF